MVRLEVEENEIDGFALNGEVASELDVKEGDLLIAKNPINHKTVPGRLEINDSLEKNKVVMDRTSFESIGLDEGFAISVSPYQEDIKNVTEAEFGIRKAKDSSSDNPLSIIKENEDSFLQFLKGKLVTKDSEVLWGEKGLILSIKETYPELRSEDVGDFTDLEEFSYSWGGSGLQSFDGVLLIDLSGSMETKDLAMDEIDWVLNRMDRSVKGSNTSEFLKNLKERAQIKRSDGAALCGLIYFVQKIGRGVGDKISVILFSDEASPVEFDEKRFFSSEMSDPETASENIIDEVNYYPRGQTNISDGLLESIETIKSFDHDKMKMIVLLTDGKPHPPSIDEPEEVLDIVEKRLAPRKDVIINTIGLGDDVDHHLLDEIASRTGGEYVYVNSLQGLTEAYSRYATSISIKATSFR